LGFHQSGSFLAIENCQLKHFTSTVIPGLCAAAASYTRTLPVARLSLRWMEQPWPHTLNNIAMLWISSMLMFCLKEVLSIEKKVFWSDLGIARKIYKGKAISSKSGF
jgi:hypothetical protein